MDQPSFQQGFQQGRYPAPLLFDQHGDDQEALNLTFRGLCDFDWNNMGHGQIASNVTGQAVAVGLNHSQAVFLGFESPLRAADAICQFPVNVQSFQQNLLPWPQPQSNTELNSCLDSNYASFSAFEQALTAGPAPATQSLGELHSNP